MHINVDPPLDLDLENGRWTLRMNSKDLTAVLKTAAIFATFAAAILSSAYLAYTNRARWAAITAAITLINVYAMPKILRHCNAAMIQNALAVNLASVSSLFLGGIAAAVFSMNRTLMASLKTSQFSTALFCAFGTTALLGYGIPLFRESIEKAFKWVADPDEWKENFTNLQEQFHRMPEIGLGLFQTNLWQSLILQLALLKPEIVLSFSEFLLISWPDYVWSMAAAAAKKVTLAQFLEMLRTFEKNADLADINQEDISDDLKENHHNRLKIAIKGLKKEELGQAVASLLESGSKFIPRVLSNEQFLEIFSHDALDATNDAIQAFLDQSANWDDLIKRQGDFEADIAKHEQNFLQFDKDSKDALNQKNAQTKTEEELSEKQVELFNQNQLLNQELSNLRLEVEKVYKNRRSWQNFAFLWENAQELPFEQGEELLSLVHDQSFMDEINKTYRSLMGAGQGQNTSIADRLQLISSKVRALQEQDDNDEKMSTFNFLSINKAFIASDFKDLQEWLNLDSPHDIEAALASIGLENEDDLYFHDILQPQDKLDKDKIRKKLQNFIEAAAKPIQTSNLVEPLEESDPQKRALELGEMVSRAVYHAICSGLILVPILVNPYAGLSGFVLGSAVFILERFGVQRAVDIVNLNNEMVDSAGLEKPMHSLFGRHVFSLTPSRRAGANQFVSSDLFGKIRMINSQMIAAVFISYFSLGSFLQGVALADEIVHPV